MVDARLTIGGLDRHDDGLHDDAFQTYFVVVDGPVPVVSRHHSRLGLKSV
jgi:hypothetical protein